MTNKIENFLKKLNKINFFENHNSYENELMNLFTEHYDFFITDKLYFKVRTYEFKMLRTIKKEFFKTGLFSNALEIGCGFGYNSFLLSPFCKNLTSLDIPDEYAVFKNQKFNNLDCKNSISVAKYISKYIDNCNINFDTSYFKKIKLPDNSVDFIYSGYVLEHIPDLTSVVQELSRIAKKDCLMIHMIPISTAQIIPFLNMNFIPIKKAFLTILEIALKKILNIFKKNKHNIPNLSWNMLLYPKSHSEFINPGDFSSQMKIYTLENYIFPFIDYGFEVVDIIQTRETNRVIIMKKVL